MSLIAREIRQDRNRGRMLLRMLKAIVARFPTSAIATRITVTIKRALRCVSVSFLSESSKTVREDQLLQFDLCKGEKLNVPSASNLIVHKISL